MTAPERPQPKRTGSHTRPVIPLDRSVWDLSLERTAYLMDNYDQVAVSFSGGKDSTATLQVALEVAHSDRRYERHLPLRVIHWDEEAIPMETEEYVRRIAQRDDVALEWYCLPVKHRNACSRREPWWWPWAPEAREKWTRDLPPEAITSAPWFPTQPVEARPSIPSVAPQLHDIAKGNAVQLMGIRAQESLNRRRMVTKKEHDNYISPEPDAKHVWKAYPIYDWTTEDVWTAPAEFGWDYNHAYDRLAMAGLSPYMQRCSPAFGEEPLQKLWTYASCFPEVWDRMVDRVPGVGAAARYALTELWSYGDRPDKPAGVSWPEFVTHYVRKFGPADQKLIGARIEEEIRYHYRRTTDPILHKAAHPYTGVRWDFLLMIAMRGDFKGRKQAGANIQMEQGMGRAQAKYWHNYVDEMKGVLAAGTTGEFAHPGSWPADPERLMPSYAMETYPR